MELPASVAPNCIMSTAEDLVAATRCADNQEVYRSLVELEAESTFAFQGARWLGDVAPSLLSEELRSRLSHAKTKAEERRLIESAIPEHVLFVKGSPTGMPTKAEAKVRVDVDENGTVVSGPVVVGMYTNCL
jgi:hypothetical protein